MTPIKHVPIARNDDIYECFPDIVRTEGGALICIYRESDGHVPRNFSHLITRVSTDDGKTWSERRVLAESLQKEGVLFEWNCPRIVRIRDGRLLALCDGFPVPPGENGTQRFAHIYFWWSDDGTTWAGPEKTPIIGIVPDKLLELPDGTWIVGTHERNVDTGTLEQLLHRSTDHGKTWEGPISVGLDPHLNLCEGSILRLPDGELVCYMRENSGKGLPIYKAFSKDDGKSWEGPYETLMGAGHRPVSGLLWKDKVLITYRHIPGGAGYWSKNLFAYLETIQSAGERDRMKQRGIILPIGHDQSEHSDSAYSGWALLPDDRVFVVTYIVDDAPMAQIRGYWIEEGLF